MDELHTTLMRALGAWRVWVLELPCDEVVAVLETVLGDARAVSALSDTRPISCVDLRAMGRQARAAGMYLIVDNTETTCAGCPAVRLGAHLSYEPLTDDVTLVGVSKDAQRMLSGLLQQLDALPELRLERCALMSDEITARANAWHETSDAAQVVAAYLRCHPRVRSLRYPGLRGDPSFEVAARTLVGGFGPFVDYQLKDQPAWVRWEANDTDAREQVMALEAMLASDTRS
ncbi:MAG: PLP-dependent transferase [Atopobiaceae bacterium]|nr:PLP-dependent transferase [Atopobiaceae bacterium]